MSKMRQELEKRLDENKYQVLEALKLATLKLKNEGRVHENTVWICERTIAKVEGK